MIRLFAALWPPEPLRPVLGEAMRDLAGSRWQRPDQLHLTVRYIGELDPRQADDLLAAFERLRLPAVSVGIDGLTWLGEGRARGSLVARATPREPLARLHDKVDRMCQRLGLPPDPRAYFPHITLARFNRGAPPLEVYLARHAGLGSAPHPVRHCALVRSHLGQDGPFYEEVARVPLVTSD
jgi:2'-5' RNA ligase